MMEDLADRLVVISGISDGLRFNLDPDKLTQEHFGLARYLSELQVHLENDGPFPEEGLVLMDLIESSDENASLAAEQFRDKGGVPVDRRLVPDSNSRVLAIQFGNTSDYLGYSLHVQTGFRWQKSTFEFLPDATTSTVFTTVYAGLGQ